MMDRMPGNEAELNSSLWKSCLIVLAVVVVLMICFFRFDTYPNPENSPLYTNLVDNPVYVKRGFDSLMLEIDDLEILKDEEAMQWGNILPRDYTGNYIMSAVLSAPIDTNHTFFTPMSNPNREFTIMIPFMLGAEVMEHIDSALPSITPGLFLAGIGANWEVFINGECVASEIHLDGFGQIRSHRSVRDVDIQLDKSILREGENVIIFRIIGSYEAVSTGLFYSSRYYIGEYADIKMQSIGILTIVFCTIYMFMGAYHLLMYIMRRSARYNLAYCLANVCITVYFISRTSLINMLIENSTIATLIECGSLYLIPLCLAVFIELLALHKVTQITKVYAAACAVLLVVQAITSIDFAGVLLNIGQVLCIAMMVYVIVFDTILTFRHRILEQRREAEENGLTINRRNSIINELVNTSLGNVFIALVFLSGTAIFDIFDAAWFHTGLVLSRYSFFLFTVSAAFILARKYSDAFHKMNYDNEQLENAVRVRTAELEEQVRITGVALRAKSEFLANMSHELRTPINAVIGMTVIGRHTADIEQKDISFDQISDASGHLLNVVTDILDMSKIESNSLELADERFNTRAMMRNVTELVSAKAAEKKLIFKAAHDENIPIWLRGDDRRLTQVITSLMSNAVKFTPPGGRISLESRLLSYSDGRCRLGFKVADTGIGISEDYRDKMFVSFEQVEMSSTRSYGGAGLGLAISKRIVELMNGDISYASKPGEGTTFTFTVELRRSDDNVSIPINELEADAAPLAGEFAGVTALLAEGMDINREIVMMLLAGSGLQFKIAKNGREAVEMFAAAPDRFDVILMDVQMPVVDGYTAAREIRAMNVARAKSVPIIAMTSNVFKEDLNECLKAGMNAYIGKPLHLAELGSVLRRHIGD